MKKITENALLFRVNQLNERMAMYEAEQGLTPAEIANNKAIANKVAAQKNAANAQANAQPNAQANQPFPGYKPYVDPAKTQQPAGKWPTTDAEIKAFQQANKDQFGKPLAVDGKIGAQTMQALAKAGIQPPAGFQMAGNKPPAAQGQHAQHLAAQHPAAHQHPAAQGQPAAAQHPAAQGQPAASPEDAARDARIQQNQAFYNLSPEDQAAINQAHGQQSLHTAASNNANAATQTAMTQGDALSKAAAHAANAALPANPPSSSSNAQGPLGVNFQSDQFKESVSFSNEDSLARILQLANW